MDDSNKGKGLIYANTKIKASLYPFYANTGWYPLRSSYPLLIKIFDFKSKLLIKSKILSSLLWFLHVISFPFFVLRIQRRDNGFARSMRSFLCPFPCKNQRIEGTQKTSHTSCEALLLKSSILISKVGIPSLVFARIFSWFYVFKQRLVKIFDKAH